MKRPGPAHSCPARGQTSADADMTQRYRRHAPVIAPAAALLVAALLTGCDVAPPTTTGLRSLYEQGQPFDAYLEDADFRQDEWRAWYERATVPEGLLARARAVPGSWKLLVITADWCGDSVRNVPYLARLAEAVDSLELRLVSTGPARLVQADYRTPDGRIATPTVLLLDRGFHEAGCWVERPSELETYVLTNRDTLDEAALDRYVVDWYEQNDGVAVLTEIVDRLEAAAAGRPICETKDD